MASSSASGPAKRRRTVEQPRGGTTSPPHGDLIGPGTPAGRPRQPYMHWFEGKNTVVAVGVLSMKQLFVPVGANRARSAARIANMPAGGLVPFVARSF